MARYSAVSSVKQAQKGNLAGLELPTGQPEPTPEVTPEPKQSGLMASLKAGPQADVEAAVSEGIEPLAAEVERQSIPSLAERGAGGPRIDRWLKPATPPRASTSQSPDGNLRSRANMMADNVERGLIAPVTTFRQSGPVFEAWKAGESQPALAERIAEEKEGDLTAALARVDALVQSAYTDKTVPSRDYSVIASAVIENSMFQSAFDKEIEENAVEAAVEKETGPAQPVQHSSGTAALGQQIHQEYQRMKGVQVPEKLPRKEAETVGGVFRDLWAESNKDLVDVNYDPKSGHKVFQLTAMGEDALKAGTADRKRLFPKKHVRPSKTPLPTGELPGDVGQNVVRRASGVVGKPEFGKVIEAAMTNLAQVPNVVNKQRAKLLYSTILPVLQSGDHSSWQAEINNFGPDKIQKFTAAALEQQKRMQEAQAAGQTFDEDIYDPQANMAALTDKIAQEVQAIARERNGANYLSYNVQGFQGRISPQQSFFDPTTSKAVRFVTTNAVPAIAKPGSRIEKNLRQMYAMMLVKDADAELPNLREASLTRESSKLEDWGDRLSQALEMTDEQYELVSAAIDQGIAVNDPNFPQTPPLALDPAADAELIDAISSKGEDGLHFIDGLIDFAKYAKAKRAGRPYASFFNAYMDGKTNGLASNGIQLGHAPTATRTGVFRGRDNRRKLLEKEGDIRDVLSKLAVDSIRQGWDGNTDGFESELNDVAEAVYSFRPFNKNVTMTFGYGKEINSFVKNVEETVALLQEKNAADNNGNTYGISLAELDKRMTRKQLAETLMNKYSVSLQEVMSDDALNARSLMRASAALHAATDTLLSIKSPIGMDLNIGKNIPESYEAADKTHYKFAGTEAGGAARRTVAHYDYYGSSAGDRDGTPGQQAYGGSVVAPVQALDATTVALTASGKSWDRMKMASGGNPYLHTIYDAFKVDAMGYDVALEEVNKNWLNSAMKWSYLEETLKATDKALNGWHKEINSKNPDEEITKNQGSYMTWMLQVYPNQDDKVGMHNLISKIGKFKEMTPKQKDEFVQKITREMAEVGYDVRNPPAAPVVKQLKRFVRVFAAELNLRPRLNAAIKRSNDKKQDLKQKILQHGYKTPSGERIALQYYAH